MANQNRATADRRPGATAWTSLEGDFGHQIEHAEREPGVGRQL